MISYSVYVVDDEETIRDGIAEALADRYKVKTFSAADPAVSAVKAAPPDLVLLDIGLPDRNGIEALRLMKEAHPEILVIMITAYEDVRNVVAAMRLGAYDYVVKPLQMDTLEVSIRNALETVRLRKEVRALQERHLKENVPCFVGESDAIQDVMDFVGVVAKSPDTPVLILGETGTGKELIASAVHYRSPNFGGSLVDVNCAAIPKELIESELFGYEKGAFTGASAGGKKGLVEQAQGGTLFLDEVGDLSLEAQAKLLRFLEEGEFFRVGGTRKLRVRTRVVSATNKDVESLIGKGLFREDLYFRLAVLKVKVPSLNERRQDIVPIALHFLVEFGDKFGKRFTGISAEARQALNDFRWKGNVRELRNVIERGVLVGKGPELTAPDLGLEARKDRTGPGGEAGGGGASPLPPEGIDLRTVLETLERRYIEQALTQAQGNESRAAQLLRMNHHTYRYRRRKLGL